VVVNKQPANHFHSVSSTHTATHTAFNLFHCIYCILYTSISSRGSLQFAGSSGSRGWSADLLSRVWLMLRLGLKFFPYYRVVYSMATISTAI